MPEVIYPIGFVDNTAKLTGNTQSGHKVVFGSLGGEQVSIKPFTGNRDQSSNRNKAEHERRMYKLVKKLGHQTLNPKSVIDGEGNTVFLISEFRPRLVPYAALNLTKTGSADESVVADLFQKVGELHTDRVTHGDAKLRNYSLDRLFPNEVVVVDLERAQDHPKVSSIAQEYFQNARQNDLSSISYNLGHNGYGTGLMPADAVDLFGDTMLMPYLKEAPRLTPEQIDVALDSFKNGVIKHTTDDHQYSAIY